MQDSGKSLQDASPAYGTWRCLGVTTMPAQVVTAPVSDSTSEPLLGSVAESLYAKALEVLRCRVGTDREGAWRKIAPLVPDVGTDIRRHLKDLRELRKSYLWGPKKPRQRLFQTAKSPPQRAYGSSKRGVCTVCHGEWPHNTPQLRSKHGRFLKLYRVRRDRWAKYPEKQDRQAQTALARRTILAARHERRVAALLLAYPRETEHLLRTQGREAVVKHFASLSKYRQIKLLKAVPPPPSRRKDNS